MNLDAARNRLVSRFQAKPMSVTERSERGTTLVWVPATFIPGRVTPTMSASGSIRGGASHDRP